MDQIRAFVGHSFSPADEEIVRKFLDFFNHVCALGIGFSWDHAEKAEPHDLREKVLAKIEDKNVFIGICTSNEIVVAASSLKSILFFSSIKTLKERDVFHKTSDWIIQEIGLAIGRGMELVLLVEKGLRQPGGLQGNIERIEFTRDRPEESFNKILEMIQSLRPKIKPIQAIEAPVPSVEARAEQKESDKDLLVPRPEWDQSQYDHALQLSIYIGNPEAETRICDAYKQIELAKNGENMALWEGRREYLHIQIGTGGDLRTIERLCATYPKLSRLEFYRGKSYLIYREPLRAAKSFEQAACLTDDYVQKLRYLGFAAKSYKNAREDKEKDRVLALLREQSSTKAEEEVATLDAVLSAIDNEGKDDVVLGCYEALASLNPDDEEVRFKLAHKYSEVGHQKLALFHYLAIPNVKRGGGAWNNIGVAYSNCKMPIRSVLAYREAVGKAETLAMSNLARKYLDAGFMKEADDLCTSATKIENYDRHVGTTISRIKEADEEERQEEDKIAAETQATRDFYREFGNAAIRKLSGKIDGRWHSERCELHVQVEEDRVKIVGRYEVKPTGHGLRTIIAGPARGAAGAYPALPPTKYAILYEGTVFGAAASCEYGVTVVDEGERSKTLLEDAAYKTTVLLVLCPDLKTIRVLEKKANGETLLEVWSRIE